MKSAKYKIRQNKIKGKSKYKGVSIIMENGKNLRYQSRIIIDGENRSIGSFKEERKAAISYDIALINNGEEPVNILKRKE